MPLLTFRVRIPTGTLPSNPLALTLTSQASAIQQIGIFMTTATQLDKCGWRLFNRGGTVIVPAMGSNDISSVFTTGQEYAWAAFPLYDAMVIPMCDQVIEGPPHNLSFQFYNTDAADCLCAGFITVRDPMVSLVQNKALYEFLVGDGKQVNNDVSPETRTDLSSSIKDRDTLAEIRRNLEPIVRPGKRNESVEHIIQK